jgi:hypothetical protein
MGNSTYQKKLLLIQQEEHRLCLEPLETVAEADKMIHFIKNILPDIKRQVTLEGFLSETEEIDFFKRIKPHILGKLFYYNKVYRIETSCIAKSGKLYYKHFSKALGKLKIEHKNHMFNSGFYQYYRSGRTDFDHIYFKLGNIHLHTGLNSFAFEIDPQVSTYYDYKAAKIISTELLYAFLISKISPQDTEVKFLNKRPSFYNDELIWTGSKAALVELIYALHVSGNISHGKIGIRKMSSAIESILKIELGDVHHTFHRMKERSGSRTAFLEQLKAALEEFMNRRL